MKQIVPYGKRLQELSSRGMKVDQSIYLFIGIEAWKKAREEKDTHEATLCLPGWEEPDKYIWPVKGYNVLIIDTSYADQQYVEDLGDVLLKNGAKVAVYYHKTRGITVYKKEFLR